MRKTAFRAKITFSKSPHNALFSKGSNAKILCSYSASYTIVDERNLENPYKMACRCVLMQSGYRAES